MKILETERLVFSKLTLDDAAFILELLNTPSWLRFIGDRGVKTVQDARNYLENGPIKLYTDLGFGFYLVKLKDTGTSIGICGLTKRNTLENEDIGFAFLPQYNGKGYGFEAGSATLEYAKNKLGLDPILAITNDDNVASIKLLQKLGLAFKNKIKLPNEDNELMLFSTNKL